MGGGSEGCCVWERLVARVRLKYVNGENMKVHACMREQAVHSRGTSLKRHCPSPQDHRRALDIGLP